MEYERMMEGTFYSSVWNVSDVLKSLMKESAINIRVLEKRITRSDKCCKNIHW